ncbi:hypothetical protein BD410DRAFT_842481 [Rickenella mellea]|uniref:DUF6533 domain-containing protein n=1 Tax=Rickenella mellea TaxID=50990 RepID=A0A4Y7PVH9_9AGAM|nr:hypothetical protein BD410DRAFT_842481 [Rickenella mellea]
MDTGFSAELRAIDVLLKQAKVVNYVNVASTALLSYDFLLTLGDEIRIMWGAKWNAGKILFFMTRYPVFTDCTLNLVFFMSSDLDPKLCAPLFKAVGWQSYFGVLVAELILMARTYAIYRRSRSVLIIFAIIFVCLNTPAVIFLNKFLKSTEFLSQSPFPTLAPCIPTSVNGIAFLDFVLLMAFELVVVILTAWKGIYQWRENQSPLMKTLVKDGVFYFFWLFAVSLANAVVLKAAPCILVYSFRYKECCTRCFPPGFFSTYVTPGTTMNQFLDQILAPCLGLQLPENPKLPTSNSPHPGHDPDLTP